MAKAITNGANGSSTKRQQWAEQIEAWRSSGESVRAFCRRRRLSEASFYWWRRRLGFSGRSRAMAQADTSRANGSSSASKSTSSPVSAAAEEAGFAELRLSEDGAADDERIELALPTGERLRIGPEVSEAHLRRVLMAVREVAGC